MKIVAIIVTFNPKIEALESLLEIVSRGVERVVVVDNASDNTLDIERHSLSCAELIKLDKNFGIATAQNIGINRAKQLGAASVILFDQDSLPAPDMISVLSCALIELSATNKVAAVGPSYKDDRQNNPTPFIVVSGLRVIRQSCGRGVTHLPVSYVIASGSLISMATLEQVGLMKEELFIDYVDIEWGLRAQSLGFQTFGICEAKMQHDLGESPIKIFGKSLPTHSPLRHYYLFRNAVFLYKNADFPILWKIGDFYRLMLKFGFYTLFAKPRSKHLTMMTKGMWDGVRGKMGKYSRA